MGQRLLQRRLTQTSSRLRELRDELRVVDDQMSHLVDEADELSLRALVSETPAAEYEYRQARKHADVIERRHRELVREIQELEQKMNDLLDRMKGNAL
jgi:predicted  nucleic acid-binding Zn-ribbon protein